MLIYKYYLVQNKKAQNLKFFVRNKKYKENTLLI